MNYFYVLQKTIGNAGLFNLRGGHKKAPSEEGASGRQVIGEDKAPPVPFLCCD